MNKQINYSNNNFNSLKISEPSICIPRTDNNITKQYVCEIFNKYNFGDIDRIDCRIKFKNSENWIYLKDGKINRNNYSQCQFFIHFKKWHINNKKANSLREKLILLMGAKKYDNNISYPKLVYKFPWYWILSPSRIYKNKIPI
tara:strand:- start:680 stop:1108 length:429 start_codon:yes stop_codon:yes gene_type:complete